MTILETDKTLPYFFQVSPEIIKFTHQMYFRGQTQTTILPCLGQQWQFFADLL